MPSLRFSSRPLPLVVLALAALLSSVTPAGAAAGVPDLLPVSSRGSLRGVLMPVDIRQLSAPSAGIIEKFGAEEGQQVAAKTMLVQLNAAVEKADVGRASAQLEAANVEVERTKRELDRWTKLR